MFYLNTEYLWSNIPLCERFHTVYLNLVPSHPTCDTKQGKIEQISRRTVSIPLDLNLMVEKQHWICTDTTRCLTNSGTNAKKITMPFIFTRLSTNRYHVREIITGLSFWWPQANNGGQFMAMSSNIGQWYRMKNKAAITLQCKLNGALMAALLFISLIEDIAQYTTTVFSPTNAASLINAP